MKNNPTYLGIKIDGDIQQKYSFAKALHCARSAIYLHRNFTPDYHTPEYIQRACCVPAVQYSYISSQIQFQNFCCLRLQAINHPTTPFLTCYLKPNAGTPMIAPALPTCIGDAQRRAPIPGLIRALGQSTTIFEGDIRCCIHLPALTERTHNAPLNLPDTKPDSPRNSDLKQ